MRIILLLLLFIALLMSTGVQSETVSYTGLPLASWHINSESDLQQLNFGISEGIILNFDNEVNYNIEGGLYYNSFRDITTYVMTSIDYNILSETSNNELRVGLFLGLFEYRNMISKIESAGGVHYGDYILIGGVQMKYRVNRVEFVAGYIPIQLVSDNSDALITFKINILRR